MVRKGCEVIGKIKGDKIILVCNKRLHKTLSEVDKLIEEHKKKKLGELKKEN